MRMACMQRHLLHTQLQSMLLSITRCFILQPRSM